MPMKALATIVLFLPALLLVAVPARGDAPASGKGMATITYSGKAPTPKDYRSAERQAELNALERYVANSTNAESRNFANIRQTVGKNLSNYILGSSIVTKQVDKNAKTLSIVLRADIDTSALANAFNASSAVGRTNASGRSYVTFIFVARQQSSVTRYGSDKSGRKASQATENGSRNQAQTNAGAEFSDQHTKIERTRSQSSQTQHAADIKYRVMSSAPVNTAMTGVFSDAGYRVVSAQFLESSTNDLVDPAAFEHDFARGNQISTKTLLNAVKGAEQVQIRYLAIGTMDEGLSNTDPQTGLNRVFVTVTGTLYGLSGPFPQTLVSVGPEQYSGEGPTESVAQTNALKLAAKAAAMKMTQAMAAQNVH
ncbi:MAG: hypothetical protein ACRES9_06895 [Gammaproteobacteria bacterium]